MAKVVFWSPDEGATGLTHSIIAASTLTAVNHKVKSLLLDSNRGPLKIESSFTPYDELIDSKVLESTSFGIGALTKIIISNKLTPSVIQNYAKPILKDKLDILYNTLSDKEEQYNLVMDNLSLIISKAELVYDLVFIDLVKGTEDERVKEALHDADVIVCVTNQDSTKLKKFFNLNMDEYYLKDKKIIHVLGSYSDKSKYNARNLRRRYGFKDELYAIPHNVYFADACNDGNIVDFFYNNANADEMDYNGNFIQNVKEISEKILEAANIKDM